MAFQAIKGGLWIPNYFRWMSFATGAYSDFTIDASAEKVAFLFQAPKTGTLDKFEWRTGTVSNIGSSVLRCSFQDVNLANGDPDGTQDQYRDISAGSITSNTWMVPGLMTSDGTDGGGKRSVTIGDWLAAVIEFQTFSASASVAVKVLGSGYVPQYVSTPYASYYTTAWSRGYTTGIVMALKYSDGSYEMIDGQVAPPSAFNTVNFNSGSTPDERGLRFKLPVPCKVIAASFAGARANDSDFVLYDSDGSTPLMSISHDGSVDAVFGTVSHNAVRFDAEVTLLKDTFYRAVLKPANTSNVALADFDVNAAEIMDAMEGGQNFHYTSAKNPAAEGDWTNTTTKRPLISLLVSALDDGVGGGGGGGLSVRGLSEIGREGVRVA